VRLLLEQMLFHRHKHDLAHALEPGLGRHVIQQDITAFGDRADTDDRTILFGHNHGDIGHLDPGLDMLWRLVGQPSHEGVGIIFMVCDS
jgi:hypothetical protein